MAAGGACAQSAPPMPGMQHHHSHAESTEKLGRVSFPTSCAAGSQAGIERGVALLHSFGYVEAQRQFDGIVKSDPGCAMAHWGIALALGPTDEPIARPAWMHFGLGLPDRDAVLALRDRLVADGVELADFYDDPDYVSVKCRDPDGYIVEASWEPE